MSEKFVGRGATIKSTGEVGKITNVSPRRSGTGAMSIRYIVAVPGVDRPYECMPHEITIDEEAPMMGMSF